MKKEKRAISLFLVLIMCLIALVGCNQPQAPVQTPTETPEETPEETPTETPELDYPKKPITMIVSFAAGGGTDLGTRILTKYAEKFVGQPITVTNIAGGGSEVGVTQLKNSPNDGYTIGGFNSASIMLTSQREAQYDPIEDFEPICLQVNDPRLFAVRADDDRFNNIEEFLKYAKDNPGELTIGTSGAGTTGHFSIEALNYYADVEINPVHFGGAGESKAAFLGAHVDGIAQTVGEVTQMVEEGQAKVIGVLSEERLEQFPDVQTFKEAGVDLVMNSARGYVAPKGTPKEIVNFLAEAFKKAMEEPEFIEEMDKMGLPIKYLGPEEYKQFNIQEKKSYDELVKIVNFEE
jgi:tripartite-type tricarboxylate transporter receptor subunit TctC